MKSIIKVFLSLKIDEKVKKKQSEERDKFRRQMESELQAQIEHMNNMPQANMEQAQRDGQQFMKENQELKTQFLAVQQANLKMIEQLSKLVAGQEEEKRRLNEKKEKARAGRQGEELLKKMEARRIEDKEKLRLEMESKMEALRKKKDHRASGSRIGLMQDRQEKLEEVEEQLEGVKEHGKT